MLESDLGQLSGAPSPAAQLWKAAAAAAAAGNLLQGKAALAEGKQDGTSVGQHIAPASNAMQQKPQHQQPKEQQQQEGAIAAWGPNGAGVPEPVAEPGVAAATVHGREQQHGLPQTAAQQQLGLEPRQAAAAQVHVQRGVGCSNHRQVAGPLAAGRPAAAAAVIGPPQLKSGPVIGVADAVVNIMRNQGGACRGEA